MKETGKEFKYLCKDFGKYDDCNQFITVNKEVYKLMAERGESLPERCENCQKSHSTGKREIRQNYFQQTFNHSLKGIIKSGFVESSFTGHGNREKTEMPTKPDFTGMRIRITDDHMKELYEKLYNNQVVILASPTGTGKSTYVFYRLMTEPTDYQGKFVKNLIRQGQIIQTQPMTEATARTGTTVSIKMLGESEISPTGMVAIKHHGRSDYSRHNIGAVLTDGTLRNWIRNGRFDQYSLIMIDEAHKRNLNIEQLLLLLGQKLSLYPHLKLIIASATINLEEFQNAFTRYRIPVGVLDLSKTLKDTADYQVHFWKGEPISNCDCWMCQKKEVREKFWKDKEDPPEEAKLPEIVSSLVIEILKNTTKGGILAFLTGQGVIEKTSDLLKDKIKRIPELKSIHILPIYSALGEEEVKKRFETNAEKRVLLTTDIAETSHTLEDLVYVIDSGYIKQSQWDPTDMTSTLPTIRHSQYGCRQRFGRVGRTQKGYVYCLYTKEEFEGKFKMQTIPEIFRSPVEETLLTLKAAGISHEPDFIGRPEDRITFNTEIKRAKIAIKNYGYTDEHENITDEGLDIFNLQITSWKRKLLDLSDEQNCFIEMLTFLSMIESDDNPRTGADAFHPEHGLLVWDPRWTAWTKLRVWKMHQALKAGCIDDLDLVLKLAHFYNQAKLNSKQEDWCECNFLNIGAFESALKWQEEINQKFFLKAEARERDLDISRTVKLRMVLTNTLKDRAVTIRKLGERLVYQFSEETYGIIPGACAGDWQDGEAALLITATKKKSVLLGRESLVSHACALVKTNPFQKALDHQRYFDRTIPIGSKVEVAEDGDIAYIRTILQGPPQIKVELGKELDFAMLMEGYLRKNYKPSIIFDEKDIKEKFQSQKKRIRAIWRGEKKSNPGIVLGWSEGEGFLSAIIVPEDREAYKKIETLKQAMVTIDMVAREPHDWKGWILASTKDGLEFALESDDLSLDYLDYGTTCLIDKTLTLPVKEVMRNGTILLSNVDKIISELRQVRESIRQTGEAVFSSVIDSINQDKNRLTVCVINDNGSIYRFPLQLVRLSNTLRIGDALPIKVTLENGQRYTYCFLEDYESESLPKDKRWKYNADSEKLTFPYFLDKETIDSFEASEELKDKILRDSWNYGFIAKIYS
ncbi:MAG: helicase-related protein [Candidatus Harrisonbacteria bacterium]|nr:helicase-related protein [Candidatus Harrisonbacteria bacterium]